MQPDDRGSYHVERLGPGALPRAHALFATMGAVFEEDQGDLADAYVEGLLARADFWALAASCGGEIVGGLTAHVLPMTRRQERELFIYDLAVRSDHQRRGVGTLLVAALRRLGAEAGITTAFVPVDDEDQHALDFYAAIGGAAAPVTIFTFETGGALLRRT